MTRGLASLPLRVEPHDRKADPMPASHVLAPHDDGRWWVAELLDQYRDRRDGLWHVVVRYTTGPGFTYIRAMPAADCRSLPDQQDDQQCGAAQGHDEADGRDDATGPLVAWGRQDRRR